MPFTDDRQGPGTLLLGATPGTEYGFQVSSIALIPAVDSVDGTPTLAVPDPAPETNTTYALEGSAIQDYSQAAGLQRYCYDNDGTETDFIWTPLTGSGGAVITGRCVVRAFTIGGNVGEGPIITDFSWPCVGKPVISSSASTARQKADAA
jgi:hypothetical protein